MSVINNALAPGYSSELPEYQTPTGGTGAAVLPPARADGIVFGSGYSGATLPAEGGGLYGGSSAGSTGLGGFGNVLNGFMSVLSNALASLTGLFGGSTSSQATPVAGSLPQTLFSSATASSIGDPHDAFAATTAQGTGVDAHWDSMQGHRDLLDSNSFNGGYRIATTGTAPQTNGAEYNGSATVTTDRGATSVSLGASGAYTVTENGQNVTLTTGQTVSLDAGETVTRNADGSLSIADSNASGGSISTTLKDDGDGGVDVTAGATNVDLGGYLVTHTDQGVAPAAAAQPWVPATSNVGLNPFGTFTSQLAGANGMTNDVAQLLQEDAAI